MSLGAAAAAEPARRGRGALLLLGVLAAAPAQADTPPDPLALLPPAVDVQPTGDLRARGQLDVSRDLHSAPDPAASFPLLARLGVQLGLEELLAARLTVGVDGALGALASEPGLQLDEAYLDGRVPLGGGLARLRFGRQALELLDGRLVSTESFAGRPRRLDALRLTAGLAGVELDSFVALPDPLRAAPAVSPAVWPDDLAAGLSLSWRGAPQLMVEAHALGLLRPPAGGADDPGVEGDERQPLRVVTLGFTSWLQPTPWLRSSTALSVQLGEARALEQQSYDLALGLELRAPWPGEPSLLLGYDLASGDRHPLDNLAGGFVNPLGERHGRFGAADLLGPANAEDLHAALAIRERGSWLRLGLHRLALATPQDGWVDASGARRSASPGGEQRLLGHELDLEGALLIADSAQVELLYAVFLPDALGRQIGPQAAHRLLVGLQLSF